MRTVPRDGRRSAARTRSRVVLPDPFAPRIATLPPDATVSERPRSTDRAPRALQTSRAATAGSCPIAPCPGLGWLPAGPSDERGDLSGVEEEEGVLAVAGHLLERLLLAEGPEPRLHAGDLGGQGGCQEGVDLADPAGRRSTLGPGPHALKGADEGPLLLDEPAMGLRQFGEVTVRIVPEVHEPAGEGVAFLGHVDVRERQVQSRRRHGVGGRAAAKELLRHPV